jgi:hypothetical protein
VTAADEGRLDAALAELRAEWGIQYRRIEPALRLLESGEPISVERLIAVTGLSHRSVTNLMRRLEGWLPLPDSTATTVPPPPTPPPHEAGFAGTPGRGRVSLIGRLVAGAPRARRELDHVAATPETLYRRAEFLAERYSLEGADVLFLGDHDLTSLALGLAVPGTRIAVVDVDEDLLAYVDRSARDLGLSVSCWFGDLRLGLPATLRSGFDLVFTDPPYTSEGLRLFTLRAFSAMKPDSRSRFVLCYGYSDLQPQEGLHVQRLLDTLQSVIEEVRPGFNRYAAAPAIGGASNLYVVQPLSHTWSMTLKETSAGWQIYSHGPDAVEAGARALPTALAEALPDLIPLAQIWRLSERHARSRPERRPALPELPAVDLRQAAGLAPRLLLVNRAPRLRMLLPAREAKGLLGARGWQAPILGAAYRCHTVAVEADLEVVEAERRHDEVTGTERLARELVEHPAASLGSTLREGLIRMGELQTKNSARTRIAAHPELAPYLAARPVELPQFALSQLASALPVLVTHGEFESRPV